MNREDREEFKSREEAKRLVDITEAKRLRDYFYNEIDMYLVGSPQTKRDLAKQFAVKFCDEIEENGLVSIRSDYTPYYKRVKQSIENL
jgi:hypothetical protein